ncbi:hypothetical protein C7271_03880 [filamentous cyanobacterium CCP5]|nr:hypothetical protein C7271_03880 [filamentous cyanobacterium CCP5]
MASLNRHFRRLLSLPGRMVKGVMVWLLRVLMISNRPQRLARSGFVLPTTVLLVLVLTLTTGALTYRSLSRSDQVIAQREQQAIQNAATPAIDRAKAKLEYLFQRDDRKPGALASSDVLSTLMKGDVTDAALSITRLGEDVYTLPDETRLDINNDGTDDNAWWFKSDINGDGTIEDDEIVAYSIIGDDAVDMNGDGDTIDNVDIKLTDPESQAKAEELVTRTGPLGSARISNQCATARTPEGGWQIVNSSENLVQKNFQVDAFVMKRDGNGVNRTVETQEFQQSREASRGSKWGAWFVYDLDIFPGPEFKWNGAMHTEGNLFVKENFQGYMVSSNDSCIYTEDASEITLNESDPESSFEGELVLGNVAGGVFSKGGNTPKFHVYNGANAAYTDNTNGVALDNDGNDSVKAVSGQTPTPYDVALNPIKIYTEGQFEHIRARNSTWENDGDLAKNAAAKGKGRVINKDEPRPYVDDFYRADNRWGPKPVYSVPGTANEYDINDINGTDTSVKVGAEINDASYPGLVDGVEPVDGFWEREAIKSGLELVVGERLQLGNPFQWNYNPVTSSTGTDALYPPNANKSAGTATAGAAGNEGEVYTGGVHEVLQHRSLHDNLGAVQSMAVYHYQANPGIGAGKKPFPAACVALTAHPGTPKSIIDSRTFGTYSDGTTKADFLRGVGTNGWEFRYPSAFANETDFGTQVQSTTSLLGIAIRNLANFAGDPSGGAPSFIPVQDTAGANAVVHPYPKMSMWGDYSNLRRILADIDANTTTYSALSPADKTTLHTAACTLSMLAYSLKGELRDQQLLTLGNNFPKMQNVSTGIRNTMDDIISCVEKSGSGCKLTALLTSIGHNPTVAWVDPNPNTVIAGVCSAGTDKAGFQPVCDTAEYFSRYSLEDWIAIIQSEVSSAKPADIAFFQNFGIAYNQALVAVRDRELGFKSGVPQQIINTTPGGNNVSYDPVTGLTQTVQFKSNDFAFRTGCNPNIFSTVAAGGKGGQDDVVIDALVSCSASETTTSKVLWPALYYLFPVTDHDHLGAGNHLQPTSEEYVNDTYIKGVNSATPSANRYKVVKPASSTDNVKGFYGLAAIPANRDGSGWILPITTPAAASSTNKQLGVTANTNTDTPDNLPFTINIPGSTSTAVARVAFLDKGMFDGREQLNERVLDIDIGRLASTRYANVNTNDFWLTDNGNATPPGEGVVYAYREDAVSEIEIVRPSASGTIAGTSDTVSFANCSKLDAATRKFRVEDKLKCRMNATPGSEQDPPLSTTGFSLKPVDFVADPMRRSYGFRLRNGADVSNAKARDSGMTFVTDNSVYILGDFNLHTNNGTKNANNLLEEFTDKLSAITNWGPGNFYATGSNGRIESEINTSNFASSLVDYWRPVEILADSVGILSGNFKDGSVLDTFTKTSNNDNNNGGSGTSSYQNQNRPYFETAKTIANWVTQDKTANTPVWVDRNGVYRQTTADASPIGGGTDWNIAKMTRFGNTNARRNNLQTASATTANAMLISGLIPTRPVQANGGFHNFPRFNEWWQANTSYNSATTDMNIAGAFLQLQFSTAATGQFDQDSWEPGSNPASDFYIDYYAAPTRNWGYDVGFQYLPAGPAAERFVSYGSPRSEYYRELPVDDPYMVLLRCARFDSDGDGDVDNNDERIDTTVDDNSCPA